jgi:predicted glutamine amidotransferase
MCRWLAYSGSPIFLKEALYEGPNSLVHQSLSSRLGAEPTNGDGFGVGWYGPVHNGYLNEFATVKRDLVFAVDPSLYPEIRGQADTEVLFYLALTFGLEEDPPAAVERAIGFVEAVAERHGVPHPFQGTVATTDGESIWAFRYSSERKSRSLFYTTDITTLRKLYPERSLFQEMSDNARMIVSEPLGDVAGVWNEVPESSYGVVGPNHAEMRPFRPKAPAVSVAV